VHKSSHNLCQSTLLLQSCNCNAMSKLQVWNLLLVICLNTSPRPTWGRSMHFYDQAPSPPPLNQITQQGCQSTGLELRIPKYMYNISWKWPSIFLETPPKIPRPPQNRLIYIPIDSSWRQDSFRKCILYFDWLHV
jgi:hypothetical protein